MRLTTLTTLTTLAALSFATTAALAAIKPEEAIHYRQAIYTVIAWNFSSMADMVKGKQPFDKAAFATHAERVADLAPQLIEGFPIGTDRGAKTAARPDVWKKRGEFEKKMQAFVSASRELATTAQGGDEAAMKDQFKTTAATCKGCHDDFRNRD